MWMVNLLMVNGLLSENHPFNQPKKHVDDVDGPALKCCSFVISTSWGYD